MANDLLLYDAESRQGIRQAKLQIGDFEVHVAICLRIESCEGGEEGLDGFFQHFDLDEGRVGGRHGWRRQ